MEKTNKLVNYFLIGALVMFMLGAVYNPSNAEAKSQRNLCLGKVGGDVRQLQIDLSKRGYHNLEPFDGIFGLKTQQAVIDLQIKNHLKPTGVYDDQLRNTINEKTDRNAGGPNAETKRVSRGASRKDVEMLARIVHGEARGEPFKGQVAVAAVVLNRTKSDKFPHSVEGVIFEPGAFDAVNDGQIWLDPDESSIKAAKLALSGYDPTGQAIYYWNPAKTTNRWIWSRPIIEQIGRHVFAK